MSTALAPFDHPNTPADVRSDMEALCNALDQRIPQKYETPANVLIATWNVREFSGLADKWTADVKEKGSKRDWRGLWAIAEIVSRFDVIAVQEVGGNLQALRTMMKTLGPTWNFIMTDTTVGKEAGGERLAYLFDTRRVQMSGLACELVVPPEWQKAADQDTLREQFVRTPYAVSFRRGGSTFVLVTLHVKYGHAEADRVPELDGIAQWMEAWARRTTDWEQNFIVLGDFNIDRRGDPAYEAFVKRGLTPAPFHQNLPRTIFDMDDVPDKASFYDQIAWFTDKKRALINLTTKSGGNFDFRPLVYREVGLTLQQMSFRLSDHYPLWIEFNISD